MTSQPLEPGEHEATGFAAPHHVVQLYESDALLEEAIAAFVGAGLASGEPVLLIATESHRGAILERLRQGTFDLERARTTGLLWILDANDTLGLFMVENEPDARRFEDELGAIVRDARAGRRDRTLRVYGEMSDVLWRRGNLHAVRCLEALWNDLAAKESMFLVCSRAPEAFPDPGGVDTLPRPRAAHALLFPLESFARVRGDDLRLREVDHLQRRARALEAEVRHREALEMDLREQSRINENLAHIALALGSELDVERLVQKVTDEATALCRAEFGAFFYNLANEKGESYTLYTLSGLPKDAFARFPMPRNTAIFEPTFSGRAVMRLDDVTKDPRYGKSAPYYGMPAGHPPVRSHLAVPVRSRSGEVLGGLFFGHGRPGMFTESDERLLVSVAAQAAVAIDNAKLFQAARQAEDAAQRERGRLETVARELETANRMKDDFLATVSHELRTPLNAILGWVRMLRSNVVPEEKKARALETIERNANAQTQLIEDLLDVSRIISGKLRLALTAVDLPRVVDDAIEAVRPAASAKNVVVRQDSPRGAPAIRGDPGRLQQVVWNLLTNAVKFTPRGGTVQVVVGQVDSTMEIVVRDSGQGIEPEFLPRVFERFRQADATPARTHGGLGLGLAIVRHLVELHGGTAKVESDGLGKGATFTVSLPISPLTASPSERPTALRVAASLDIPQELAGVHVLVVDDEPDAREVVAETLESCKAKVTTAASAADALRLVQELRPDVVVSDIGMPGEDGYVFIKKLRALSAADGGRTPAVALTAYTRVEDRTKALVAGFNMHVPKPVEPSELLAILASLTTMFAREGPDLP